MSRRDKRDLAIVTALAIASATVTFLYLAVIAIQYLTAR